MTAANQPVTYRGYSCDAKQTIAGVLPAIVKAYERYTGQRPLVLLMHPEDVPNPMPLECNGIAVATSDKMPRRTVYANHDA